MRLQKSPRSVIEHAYKAALEPSTHEDDDREFRDFIESVSVTQDELTAIVSMSKFHFVSVTFELERSADRRPQPSTHAAPLRWGLSLVHPFG